MTTSYPHETGTATAIVAGVGNRYRGDDGLGPAVVDLLVARLPDTVTLMAGVDDPLVLIDAWDGIPLAVVVDAVVSRAPVGTVHEIEMTGDSPGELRGLSTHVFSVAQAIELGIVLDRMPRRLVVLGVEAGDVTRGRLSLTPLVAAAVESVAARVEELIEGPPREEDKHA